VILIGEHKRREIVTLVLLLSGFAAFFTILFAPVLFSGNYMTGGDGLLQALPTYLGRNPLWEPNIMLGYPLFADPNQAYWYPLLRVLRAIPFSFNVYVVAPYALSAFGVAAFTRRLSESTLAGIVAGLTFSLGGFMISHAGHLNLIHPAAWTPYLLWAIEELRRRPSFTPVAGGSIVVALSAVSGPQQPFVYITLVGLAYAVLFSGSELKARAQFLKGVALMFALGIGLSAISLVPTAELAAHSSRAHQDFGEFTVFSTNRVEFPVRMLFPYFFGATPSALYPFSHGDVGSFPEASNYVGVLSLMLAFIALARQEYRRQVLFWFAVAIWASWMSIGDGLFAARFAYLLPVYGMFRIPGRHALEFTMAISALASFGVSTLERSRVTLRSLALAIASLGSLLATLLLAIAFRGNTLRTAVSSATAAPPAPAVPLLPWENPALGIPCAVFLVSAFALLVWARLPNRVVANAIGILAVTGDMLTFAGCSYWRYTTVSVGISQPPPVAIEMRNRLRTDYGRMLAASGAHSVPPNLSALWLVPSVDGYVSLEDKAVAELLHLDPAGQIPDSALALYGNKSLDIVGARYILLHPQFNHSLPITEEFVGESLDGFIGADAITPDKSLVYGLATPHAVTAIDLVSALGLSVRIPNRTIVADLVVTDVDNRSFSIPIVVGRDTSESAYDRPDVRPLVRHDKARVFSGDMAAQLYFSRFRVPTTRAIRRLTIHWRYPDLRLGAMTVVHLALVDERKNISYPITPRSRFYSDPQHWQMQGLLGNDVLIKNRQALPDAWAVTSVRVMTEDQQKSAIQEPAPENWTER